VTDLTKQAELPSNLRFCFACYQVKPKTAFGRSHCRQCERKYNLKTKYDITPVDYQRMLSKQGGRCALCHVDQPGDKHRNFCVDHNHKTGEVRGLLCRACNRHVVGFIEKREISLDHLRAYLDGAYALKR
jgi:hypothetical protein